MKFTVPGIPVSINKCWKTARNGRMYMSHEGRAWMAAVALCAKVAMRGAPMLEGPLVFRATWYFNRAIGGTEIGLNDDDGPLKPARDSLEGVVYTNDKWIVESHTRKGLDRERPRAEIEVMEAT